MPSTALKIQRFFRDLSQEAISRETGLSQSCISRLERGVASKTPKNAEARARICTYFNVPEDLLFPADVDGSCPGVEAHRK